MDRNKVILEGHIVTGGQARKSLWIETEPQGSFSFIEKGQARKSLWIETVRVAMRLYTQSMVRLVRACGSKLLLEF